MGRNAQNKKMQKKNETKSVPLLHTAWLCSTWFVYAVCAQHSTALHSTAHTQLRKRWAYLYYTYMGNNTIASIGQKSRYYFLAFFAFFVVCFVCFVLTISLDCMR